MEAYWHTVSVQKKNSLQNLGQTQEMVTLYRQCRAKLAEQVRNNPLLHAEMHTKQEHSFIAPSDSAAAPAVQFKWQDTDMMGGEVFVPEIVKEGLAEKGPLERSGDRRQKLLEEQRNRHKSDATKRLEEREVATATLLERDEEDIMEHVCCCCCCFLWEVIGAIGTQIPLYFDVFLHNDCAPAYSFPVSSS